MENSLCWNALYPEIGILFSCVWTILTCWKWIRAEGLVWHSLPLAIGLVANNNFLVVFKVFWFSLLSFVILVFLSSLFPKPLVAWPGDPFPGLPLPSPRWAMSSTKAGSKHSPCPLLSCLTALTTTTVGPSPFPSELEQKITIVTY